MKKMHIAALCDAIFLQARANSFGHRITTLAFEYPDRPIFSHLNWMESPVMSVVAAYRTFKVTDADLVRECWTEFEYLQLPAGELCIVQGCTCGKYMLISLPGLYPYSSEYRDLIRETESRWSNK